jgi:hypothetical protein
MITGRNNRPIIPLIITGTVYSMYCSKRLREQENLLIIINIIFKKIFGVNNNYTVISMRAEVSQTDNLH